MKAAREDVEVRLIAVVGIFLFFPVIVSFAVAPGVVAFEYIGILFHLTLFLLVARLKAPEWAKAAGYGWLILDVATGALIINSVPYEIAIAVRFGGHVLGGVWIATSSQLAPRTIAVVGTITDVWLAGYTFVAPFVPKIFLAPASLLVIVWLGLLAWKSGALYASQEAG